LSINYERTHLLLAFIEDNDLVPSSALFLCPTCRLWSPSGTYIGIHAFVRISAFGKVTTFNFNDLKLRTMISHTCQLVNAIFVCLGLSVNMAYLG